METNGIMIDDWVTVNDTEHKNPLQVAGLKNVSGEFYAELVNPYDATDHCECIISKVEGVPVTSEILEINGWQRAHYASNFRWRRRKNGVMLEVLLFADGLIKLNAIATTYNDGIQLTLFDLIVRSMPELQHACLMCGVDVQWEMP